MKKQKAFRDCGGFWNAFLMEGILVSCCIHIIMLQLLIVNLLLINEEGVKGRM